MVIEEVCERVDHECMCDSVWKCRGEDCLQFSKDLEDLMNLGEFTVVG